MIKVIIDNAMLSAFLQLNCIHLLVKIAKKFGWLYEIPAAVRSESLRRSNIQKEWTESAMSDMGVVKRVHE